MNRLLALDRDTFNLATPVVDTPFRNLALIRPLNVIGFVVSALILVGALAFFIYLMWGAVQWITAGGDKEGVEKARKKINHAIVGLAILFSVYAILTLMSLLFFGDLTTILSIPIPTL